MSDLIVAGFDDVHTAFLARAALARLQSELSLLGHDIAVMTREADGQTTLQEAIDISGEQEMQPTYWKTLVSLLFASGPSTDAGGNTTSAKLAAIGIDETFRSRFAKQIRAETSAILVLVSGPVIRDQVLGVLRGFQGEIMRTELTGDGREVWRRALLDAKQREVMK